MSRARRTSAERIALHNTIKRVVKVGAGGLAVIGAAGYGLASWVEGGGSETPRAAASSTPPPRQGEAFPTDESTYDIANTPEPQRSSVDDLAETPDYGWTSDPSEKPEQSASAKPSAKKTTEAAETDKTDPCHWDVTTTKRAGKKVIIATVKGYEECVDGEMRDAMMAYEKPSIESEHAFGLSNAQTVQVGCRVEDDTVNGSWYVVRSAGIAGDNRAFVQSSILGAPEAPTCPPDYQAQVNQDGTR